MIKKINNNNNSNSTATTTNTTITTTTTNNNYTKPLTRAVSHCESTSRDLIHLLAGTVVVVSGWTNAVTLVFRQLFPPQWGTAD